LSTPSPRISRNRKIKNRKKEKKSRKSKKNKKRKGDEKGGMALRVKD
jgi:hypothetical protein